MNVLRVPRRPEVERSQIWVVDELVLSEGSELRREAGRGDVVAGELRRTGREDCRVITV